MSILTRITRSRHIHEEVGNRFKQFLPTGKILDLPAGDGVNARQLQHDGYEVVAADLFADAIQGNELTCVKADLNTSLPFENDFFDGMLFSEGIEHLDGQVFALQEAARVIKPGGLLIVTTPNLLSLAARLNFMLTGHAHTRRAAVVSPAQYWGGRHTDGHEVYFGHVFLINAFQLRFYLEHAGFEIIGVDTARYSLNSLLLSPLMFPAVWWSTKRFLAKPKSKIPESVQSSYLELILSPAVLFGKKLIMTARRS